MEKIPIVAFEGINRAGKGTQIELLKKELMEIGLSSVGIRGDGTRDGLGYHDGDPINYWWQKNSKKIRESGSTEERHEAAYQLSLDLISWKNCADDLRKDLIILDRSLLSRATFVIDREDPKVEILEINDLYPIQKKEKLELEDILPDIIIELVAPKDVILSRLDSNDPKFKFRENIINSNYDKFYSAKNRLPRIIRDRIITIDSSQPIDVVFDQALENLNSHLKIFKKDKK